MSSISTQTEASHLRSSMNCSPLAQREAHDFSRAGPNCCFLVRAEAAKLLLLP
jgi:hypothetical protein